MAGLTVREVLERLFPLREGADWPYYTFEHRKDADLGGDPYATPPAYPPDMFAAAAQVVELSGAYHHVRAGHRVEDAAKRQIFITPEQAIEDRASALTLRGFVPGEHWSPTDPTLYATWRGLPEIARVFDMWHLVFSARGGEPVFRGMSSDDEPPQWWLPAIRLLVIADEASEGLGYVVATREPRDWMDSVFELRFTNSDAGEKTCSVRPVKSLTSADPDVATVLPKARTATVGCTMRSLSCNLALLPPRGVARGNWTPYLFKNAPSSHRHMNLLLVPCPYSVRATDFRHRETFSPGGGQGYFDIEQSWLGAENSHNPESPSIVGLVCDLVEHAKRDCDEIHGIVLPELALDQRRVAELADHIESRLPEVEFLISGVSEVEEPEGMRSGNFVTVQLFHKDKDSRERVTTRREKHHRWRLDSQQVCAYGLEGVLSPSYMWWENIDLLSRRVDFAVVRERSVVAAMICEDLARVDPCQELLRAVGPNIVVAHLMDAPQLKDRWPARYATILAEDPGSSVLTLTSRALMSRQHRLGLREGRDERRVVALWRDDTGIPKEITCPIDAQAVRLSLFSRNAVDQTIDGRVNRRAVAWRYAMHQSIALDEKRLSRYTHVLGEDDEALRRGKAR